MSPARRWLYLFSSNQSPLYAQDVLNVLALPDGQSYTFRYDAKYVTAELVGAWPDLQDTHCVVVFSLQQRARYHAPAFVPVRRGVVTSTAREGRSLFVTFRAGPYVSLFAPPTDGGREQPGEEVGRFTMRLRTLTDTPYEASASLGSAVPDEDWDAASEASVLFARTGDYLSQTEVFAQARFVRVLGIKPTGAGEDQRLRTTQADPAFVLEAGMTYDLEVFHAQPTAPATPQRFAVVVDGSAIKTIGQAGFEVASRYDRTLVRLAATQATGLEDRATVVAIEPDDGIQGPRVTLDVRVRAGRGRAIGIATAQAIALIAVALAGALTMWPIGARIALAVVGAVAAVLIGLVGGAALRTPTLPSAPRPAKS
jgi:hypothetical protein